MAFEIKVPRLGWTMEEGVFVEWLKRDGDVVQQGDPIFTLEGDKVTEEIEAFDSGTLRIPDGAPSPGDSVLVGAVVAYIVAEGESVPALNERAGEPEASGPAAAGFERDGEATAAREELRGEPRIADKRGPSISPRAARRALELGLDYRSIVGTGRSGRIRERDVLAAAATRFTNIPGGKAPTDAEGRQIARSPASSARRAIADRVVSSARNTAAVTICTTVDAQALVDSRCRLANAEPSAIAPTYNDLLIGIVAAALRRHPGLNAWWIDGAPSPRSDVNVGFAVDLEGGLAVPVIRCADVLDVEAIAARTRTLIERARAGSLSSEDVTDGTFTITNLGMFGVDSFSPLIHEPQVAVLGVGRIRETPRVSEGRVVPGVEVTLSLTFDHRALDGAPAARFLETVRASIERGGPRAAGS